MRTQGPVLLLVSFFFVKFAQSQSNDLNILGQTGKLYLEHTVAAKENWYSIGRLFNANPKEMAPFNHLVLTQPLAIGQVVQIPLTAVNFSQDGRKTPAETLIPVFHIVQEKEWMYRISVNHNKVAIATLEKWNKIRGDQVHPGLHMIVGYLKVKTALSALTAGTTAPAVAETPAATGGATPAGGTLSAIKTAVADSPASAPVPAAAPPTTPPPAAPHFNGGLFKADFNDGGKSATGQAGVFKSTSGWQDGKYYALMNNVPVGTIVKASDVATGKSVYAKILGQLPDMKESTGLTIRVSNAAAAELGEGDGRFNITVNY